MTFVYIVVLEKQRWDMGKEEWVDLLPVEKAYLSLGEANKALSNKADIAEQMGSHVEVERLDNGSEHYRQIKIRQMRSTDYTSLRYTFGYVKQIKLGKDATKSFPI